MNDNIPFTSHDADRTRSRNADPFFQIPAWVHRRGLLAMMNGSLVKVLCSIAAHADNYTHVAWAKNQKIAEESGICESSVSEITKTLVIYGVLEKHRRGNRNTYLICFKEPDWLVQKPKGWRYPLKHINAKPRPRDTQTQQFSSGNFGDDASEKESSDQSVKFGDGLKSSSASSEGVSSSEVLEEEATGLEEQMSDE